MTRSSHLRSSIIKNNLIFEKISYVLVDKLILCLGGQAYRDSFEKLTDVYDRKYGKAINIFEKISKIKMFLIMLDLECDDVVMEMFQHFLRIIRLAHSQYIFLCSFWNMSQWWVHGSWIHATDIDTSTSVILIMSIW